MKKLFYALVLNVLSVSGVMAQQVVPLYTGPIPGAKPIPANYKEHLKIEKSGVLIVSKVTDPTLTVYLPKQGKSNGTAVIICPGGGYGILALGHEGYDVAKRFSDIGITAFVLKYRLPNDEIMNDKFFGPLQDVQQAIYLVRRDASKWNINADKIGIMGFSAGGHLASSLSVHYNDVKIENKEHINLRPDFSVLIYPVISFTELPHTGSVRNLIGPDGTDAEKLYFSSEKNVNDQTPKAFLVQAADDETVPVQNTIVYAQALIKHNIPAEMHIYQAGGHGFGLDNKTTKDQWFDRLVNWMDMNKLLK